jgi:hypothetical protein
MKNMSFSITTQQVRDRSKDVTRRWGWYNAKPGDRYNAVEKAMGLKKGEKIVRLAVVEVVKAHREALSLLLDPFSHYRSVEMVREGFPGRDPWEFASMLHKLKPKRCKEEHPMRIEFKYVVPCERCHGSGMMGKVLECLACAGAG